MTEHDTVSRRMRDMTDDDGAPLKANSYGTTATPDTQDMYNIYTHTHTHTHKQHRVPRAS